MAKSVLEAKVRDYVAARESGKTEVDTGAGRADIVTAEHVIEVKHVKNFCSVYHAIGQAQGYALQINRCDEGPPRVPRVHLFGTKSAITRLIGIAREACDDLGVMLTHEVFLDTTIECFSAPMSGGAFVDLLIGTHGQPILALRESDGYVWVSTMLHSFDKKLANFKAHSRAKSYMYSVAEELGMNDADGQIDPSQLFKWGISPFDQRVEGYYAHIEILTKLAGWVHAPFERVCHRIVIKFYTGQLTTSDSLTAASTIARQLGLFAHMAAARAMLPAALNTAEDAGALAQELGTKSQTRALA